MEFPIQYNHECLKKFQLCFVNSFSCFTFYLQDWQDIIDEINQNSKATKNHGIAAAVIENAGHVTGQRD